MERIGIVGYTDTGKTSAVVSLAALKPDSIFYVLDSEGSFKPIWDEFGGAEAIPNIKLYVAPTYERMKTAAENIFALVGNDDWIVVEGTGLIYSAVQNWYSVKVFGKERADYFVERRKELLEANQSKRPASFEVNDWLIMRMHNDDIVMKLLLQTMDDEGNGPSFIATSQAKGLIVESERDGMVKYLHADEIPPMFKRQAVRAEGEKHIWESLWTIFYMDRDENTNHIHFRTVKEKMGRPLIKRTATDPDIKTLWMDYEKVLKVEANA